MIYKGYNCDVDLEKGVIIATKIGTDDSEQYTGAYIEEVREWVDKQTHVALQAEVVQLHAEVERLRAIVEGEYNPEGVV